jgi:KUP system potassium uptake protein
VLLTFLSDRRPRVPFPERHKLDDLGSGCYRIIVRLGFMQQPDIPLSVSSCAPLGLTGNLDDVHYFIGREIAIRRSHGSAMTPPAFAVFAFLTRITARSSDFYKIPDEAVSEVGFRVQI